MSRVILFKKSGESDVDPQEFKGVIFTCRNFNQSTSIKSFDLSTLFETFRHDQLKKQTRLYYSELLHCQNPGVNLEGLGVGGPNPLEFSKYTNQRTTFSTLPGGIFTCTFRSPIIISIYIYSITAVQRFFRLHGKLQGRASFIYFLHSLLNNRTSDIYSSIH